jgi:negative regulator of flagellin synthesis FlgM
MTETSALASTNKAAQAQQSSADALTAGGSAAVVDDAKLSATASMVAQSLSESDVRPEKVAALQQTIAAGTYSVSSADVADKLMGAMLR